MDTALDFQHLIQKAYTTTRLGVYEADTNLYRRYEEALKNYEQGIAAQSPNLPDLAFKAGKKTGKIVVSLQRAFYHVLHTTQAPMSQQQVDELEALSLLLMEDATEANIARAIAEGNRVLDEIGVESLRS
jgi:hypothetical protein